MNHSQSTDSTPLLLAAKLGDQSAFERLLERYSPLIDSMTSEFAHSISGAEYEDDFRQEACIAFFNAVKHFDAEQNEVQFGLFAKICIRHRLVSYRRSLRKQEPMLSLDETVTSPEEEKDPSAYVEEEENYQALYRLIEATLSPYENRIWWLYLSGRTAKEIAFQLEKDERSVQNAVYRIRKKLRTALQEHMPE
ncbi:MAG: sigma-70 family RNA polymerase sigma factor [Clostridia bacterium]|nr:sigma-70 family RNA polymerase sigma factor [Clostridia bacterium]